MEVVPVQQAQEVLDFWFKQTPESAWWNFDPSFDHLLTGRFAGLHRAATRGELWAWRETAEGRLAEVIVLDQFSRNIYRDTPMAFAADGMALILAQEALAAGAAQNLHASVQAFFFMPFMHSESLAMHERAVGLFSQPGLEGQLAWELKHKAVIERFGRYPHRNAVLCRLSTPEELAFLAEPGSSF